MADNFDSEYEANSKKAILERLQTASSETLVLVDEVHLAELWPASDDEKLEYPNIKFSHVSILTWLLDNELDGWKPVVVEKSDSEHHNFSTGERYFRPMAFRKY